MELPQWNVPLDCCPAMFKLLAIRHTYTPQQRTHRTQEVAALSEINKQKTILHDNLLELFMATDPNRTAIIITSVI